MPHGVDYCQLQLLFVWLFSDQLLLRILQAVDATSADSVGGFQGSFQDPAQPSNAFERLGRALELRL